MISLYSGTPGSGKSLHIAMRLYGRLRAGKPCIANFKLKLQNVRKKEHEKLPFTFMDNSNLSPDNLVKFAYKYFGVGTDHEKPIKEGEILLVIDEAALLFNARTWMEKGRERWLYFFNQHRKYGYEVVLVAQFDGMIDRQIRSVIEYNIAHRKVSNFGIGGKIINLFGGGGVLCAVKIWYPLNEVVGKEFFKIHKKYFKIYDTFGNFLSEDEMKRIERAKEETAKAISAASDRERDGAEAPERSRSEAAEIA